jgi:hypothetical protein
MVGAGLLGLAFAIRRMTTRTPKSLDTNRDWETPELPIDSEPEADDPELLDPAAPLLHRDATDRGNSISLSQSS